MKKTDFLVYMQARDMMCRYESRALSASDIGNKSFRFRISALIWSRRALDAPLVERYMVIGRRRRTVGVLASQSGGVVSGVRLKASAAVSASRMCSEAGERRSSAVLLLDCHISSLSCPESGFQPFSCLVQLRHSVQLCWLLACWICGAQVIRRLCVRRLTRTEARNP